MRKAFTVVVMIVFVVTALVVTGCNSKSSRYPSNPPPSDGRSDSELSDEWDVDTTDAEDAGYDQGYSIGYDGYYYENDTDYSDADIPDGGYSTDAENAAFEEGWTSGWNAGMDAAMQDVMDRAAEEGERW